MIATIDIGTNSVRLFVGYENQGRLTPVMTDMKITRLGAGVDATGTLSDLAMDRTCKVLLEYNNVLSEFQLDKLVVTATSAVRDAINQAVFLKKVAKEVGLRVKVLSGEEEAQAAFFGAIRALKLQHQITSELMVLDIGGGSTELIYGLLDGTIIRGISSQVGSVRMTEISRDSQLKLIIDLINERIRAMLTELKITTCPGVLIGVGGTITTLAALELGLQTYDAQQITGFKLSIDQIDQWFERLLTMDVATRGILPGMNKREDVIVAGVAILHSAMVNLGVEELIVSDGDLLQGIIFL